MDNMGNEYRRILENIEERLKDNPELEYVKSEFTNLFMVFFNEIDSLRELYEEKVEAILDRQSYFDEKISKIEEKTSELEKELLCDEDNDECCRDENHKHYYGEEFDVNCPYCGQEFAINSSNLQDEMNCPYCDNLIELDWNDNMEIEDFEDEDM